MRRLGTLALSAALVLSLLWVSLSALPAQAEPECQKVAPRTGQCMVYVPPPPDYPAPPRDVPGDPGDGSGGEEPVCADPLVDRVVPL